MKKLAPSILSADFSKLGEDVAVIEKAGAHLIHVDVMDGHFVPNISYGATVMKSLVGKTKMPFDVHLMIENTDQYIEEFVTENTEYITVHQEACTHLDRTVGYIKSFGVKAGIALNPETDVKEILEYLPLVDMVLVMSVHPGYGGQKYIEDVNSKITFLRTLMGENFNIEVDGGVNISNIKKVVGLGANVIVAGSAVFNDNIEESTKALIKECEE